jgi:hypothetical protein
MLADGADGPTNRSYGWSDPALDARRAAGTGPDRTDPDVDTALDDMTEWWLTQLEHDREIWLAVLGARGMGRDPEVEALLDDIEERARAGLVAHLSERRPSCGRS